MAQGVKAVLVACNTATALAVDLLRARFPVPVVAMEPGQAGPGRPARRAGAGDGHPGDGG